MESVITGIEKLDAILTPETPVTRVQATLVSSQIHAAASGQAIDPYGPA